MAAPKKKVQQKVKTTIDSTTVIGTEFAQSASVFVTRNEVIFDFVFVHPQNNYKEGQVVSRVTMPKAQAADFIKLTQQLLDKNS